jgi:ribose transport system ATP-binding protein
MFTLKSDAFNNGGIIPEKYAEANIISPPILWEDAPAGTRSYALAVTDPDLPAIFQFPRVFAHWMIYNIPASISRLSEGVSPKGTLPPGAKELNSDYVTFKMPGYGKGYAGPWPPDAAHRYVFTIYALKNETIEIPETGDYVEFVKAVLPVTIASASLTGLYGPAKMTLPGA